MELIKRLYFDKDTGTVIDHYFMFSDVVPSVDEDIDRRSALEPYREQRERIGVMKWTELNVELEVKFAAARALRVDVSKTLPELVFEYPQVINESVVYATLLFLGIDIPDEQKHAAMHMIGHSGEQSQ